MTRPENKAEEAEIVEVEEKPQDFVQDLESNANR